MHASLIAMAVAYAFPLMPVFGVQAQWDQTEWPHGYRTNPFLARGPMMLAQHGKRLAVQGQLVTIDSVSLPRGMPFDYVETKRHGYEP